MINIIDILPFAITEFSRIFIESMNKEEITFKSQFILQSLAKLIQVSPTIRHMMQITMLPVLYG